MGFLWTIYLERKDNSKLGKKVFVNADHLTVAQRRALHLYPDYKLYGFDEEYFVDDKDSSDDNTS